MRSVSLFFSSFETLVCVVILEKCRYDCGCRSLRVYAGFDRPLLAAKTARSGGQFGVLNRHLLQQLTRFCARFALVEARKKRLTGVRLFDAVAFLQKQCQIAINAARKSVIRLRENGVARMKVSMISDRAKDVACLTGCVSCCGGRAELLGHHPVPNCR